MPPGGTGVSPVQGTLMSEWIVFADPKLILHGRDPRATGKHPTIHGNDNGRIIHTIWRRES